MKFIIKNIIKTIDGEIEKNHCDECGNLKKNSSLELLNKLFIIMFVFWMLYISFLVSFNLGQISCEEKIKNLTNK